MCVCVSKCGTTFCQGGIEQWSSNTLDKDDDCNGQDEACAFNALQLKKTGKKDDGADALASVSRLTEWDEPVNISMSNSSEFRLGKTMDSYCAEYCSRPGYGWSMCLDTYGDCLCLPYKIEDFGSWNNGICSNEGKLSCHIRCYKMGWSMDSCPGGSCLCHDQLLLDAGFKCS